MFTIDGILSEHRFLRWLLWRDQSKLMIGKKEYRLISLSINPFSHPLKGNATYSLSEIIDIDQIVEMHIQLGLREGQIAFTMNNPKCNRNPKFIKLGTDPDIINLYTEYKLLNT